MDTPGEADISGTSGSADEGASADAAPTNMVILSAHPDKDSVVEALAASWAALAALAEDFDEEQWNADSPLPGWSVRDIYAHIIGTERVLAGEETPEIDLGSPAHVHNDIGRLNEAWVRSLRTLEPNELHAAFVQTTTERIAALHEMSDADWEAPSWTPAGDATLGRWMHIRVFDCWSHEQDVRVALGLPGGLDGPASELSLQEVVFALGFIVGKRGEAEDGSRIAFILPHGSTTRELRVAVDEGRAAVTDAFDRAATTTLTMPYELFMRLVAGRRSASNALSDGLIQLDGDTRSGERIARNLAFTV